MPMHDFDADAEQLTESIMTFVRDRISKGSDPTWRARDAQELEAAVGQTVTREGLGGEEALRLFTDHLVTATRAMDHPRNLGYVPSAPTPAASLFDTAVSACSIFAGLWEAGAGAIFAENQALAWLASLAGFPEGAGGCFVPGGTIANLSALVTARHTAQTRRGGEHPVRWAFAATGDAHASLDEAARVMDVDVVRVPGDERGALTAARLADALDGLGGPDGVGHGEATVFAAVASAGTTNAGVIDDLAGVAAVCRERGLWLHVDGAYGLAALAAPTARHRFAGIEQADSFCVDPHKWLFAPYDAAALVYRDPALGQAAHSQRASYLAEIDRELWNPSEYGVHLSRRARGLPFWFSLATHGTDAYAAAVETTLAVARAGADEIRRRPYLRLLFEPDLTVLLFERTGWDLAQYQAWSTEHAVHGTFLVVPTRWHLAPVARMCIVNPRTTVTDVCDVLDSMA